MATPSLVSQLSGITKTKAKDVPAFLSSIFSRENLGPKVAEWSKTYQNHMDKGDAKPLFDVIGGVFALSYVLVWPIEVRHMKHALHEKEHGKH